MHRTALLILALALVSRAAGSAADSAEADHAHPRAASPSMTAHGDHAPKHGGTFFMASDKFHHVEGTYPEAGLFRLYLYDDHTRPIDPAKVQGMIELESQPEGPGARLSYEPETKTLAARMVPAPPFPVDLDLWLVLPGMAAGAEGALFSFRFVEPTTGGAAPSAAGAHAHAAGHRHAHGSPHGGQVVTAGAGHHLELVSGGPVLMLYVLDAAEKTLPIDGMEASLTFQPTGGVPKVIRLDAHGNHFMADSPLKSGESAVAVVSVKVGGSTRTARFTVGRPAPAAAEQPHRH